MLFFETLKAPLPYQEPRFLPLSPLLSASIDERDRTRVAVWGESEAEVVDWWWKKRDKERERKRALSLSLALFSFLSHRCCRRRSSLPPLARCLIASSRSLPTAAGRSSTAIPSFRNKGMAREGAGGSARQEQGGSLSTSKKKTTPTTLSLESQKRPHRQNCLIKTTRRTRPHLA